MSSSIIRPTRSGRVERQAMRDAGAAVVGADVEALVAERGHQRDRIGGHRRACCARRAWHRPQAGRIAVAAQVHRDDAEALGERRRDPVPHRRGLRMAVQQQQRRAGAAAARMQLDAGMAEAVRREAFEHAADYALAALALAAALRSRTTIATPTTVSAMPEHHRQGEDLAEQQPGHHRGARRHQVEQARHRGRLAALDQQVEQRAAAEGQHADRPGHRQDEVAVPVHRLGLEQSASGRQIARPASICTALAVRTSHGATKRFW